MSSTSKEAITKTVEVEGIPFAYREVARPPASRWCSCTTDHAGLDD